MKSYCFPVTIPPKALYIEEVESSPKKVDVSSTKNMCVLCGFEASDQEDLSRHNKTSHPAMKVITKKELDE